MFGASTYTSMVVEIVDELRPHVLLVNPPYDHLNTTACQRIRNCGTRIIGLAFDDPCFQDAWGEREFSDLRERFDRWVTTAVNGPTVSAGATSVLWTMAPESVNIDDPSAPTYDVVMFGRYTKKRQEIARAVAENGFNIACFGSGWAAGPVTRPSRLGLMRRAQSVIVPSDGTDFTPVYMTEAALTGTQQIVELVPGLERYWLNVDPPATYVTTDECVHWLTVQKEQRMPWTEVPTWEQLWPDLLIDLPLADQPERIQSPTLAFLFASLTHFYRERGQLRAAVACLDNWADAAPGDPGPNIQMAFYASAARRWEDTVQLTVEAEQMLKPYVSPAVVNLKSFFPDPHTIGPSLMTSSLDPSLEIVALRLHALLKMDRVDDALEEVRKMSCERRRAVLNTIHTELGSNRFSELLEALNRPQTTEAAI